MATLTLLLVSGLTLLRRRHITGCAGPAVWLNYRICPECGAENLINCVRLTEQGQARRQEIKAEGSRQEGPPGIFGGSVATIMMLPMEVRYWHKQADGSYGWT